MRQLLYEVINLYDELHFQQYIGIELKRLIEKSLKYLII